MKKLHVMLMSIVVALSANLFAANVGDSVSYVRNSNRTDMKVWGAQGSVEVINTNDSQCPNGYVVKMKYDLDVYFKGKQTGELGVCVPKFMFNSDFYIDLSQKGMMSFGSFNMSHQGKSNAVDANGTEFQQCDVIYSDNINHNFKTNNDDANNAWIMWFNWNGSIEWVTDLKVTFRSNRAVKVLGAVEIDISGVSNNGISFNIGLDANI